ncbi:MULTISPECIES: hypothetical protein [Pedobacter]|uniref:hypothetical protein n=1 Tax=Pedobacter TaxID=84567 RepID=UPI00292F86FA|nr:MULTISPECIES: hypothetical protein [Pedobacter]
MNTIYKRFSASSYYLFLLCLLSIFSSCKKEYEDFPYTDIVSFTIKDAAGNPLKAVIDEKNLIIYWPSNQAVPDNIVPDIVLSERATVSPASGQSIAFKETTKFVVTAQNGATKEYLIKKVINQPLLKINVTGGVLVYNTKNYALRGNNIAIGGDNIIADKNQTKVYLINTADNTEKELAIGTITPIAINVTLGSTTPDGIYKLKVVSGQRTVIIERTFGISSGFPRVSLEEIAVLKKTFKLGEEFTLNGTNRIEQLTKFTIRNLDNQQIYELPIKEAKTGQLTLKVPENLPTGQYDLYIYNFPGGEYYAAGSAFGYFDELITITN